MGLAVLGESSRLDSYEAEDGTDSLNVLSVYFRTCARGKKTLIRSPKLATQSIRDERIRSPLFILDQKLGYFILALQALEDNSALRNIARAIARTRQ